MKDTWINNLVKKLRNLTIFSFRKGNGW
jgi:hypothetical protein